ncbi:hypothetical protein BS47DRAFT_1353720 [Hydnum rufescens UP504]|uniref:Uncharacterized protein n=1 Tax=Hydnum rufescens UP504 TaxID=1448309 RepID=A0A9P6DPI4_9AGAM|nr:hypothetical protein BS47DRAFT_1353720 [Hydnum rufescens UP504]
MAHPAMNNASPRDSPTANFTPRQEFVKAPIVPHAFGLVSFNGSGILRLANFSVNVTQAVRRALWDEIRDFREDADLAVCELLLAGRPFSGRSVRQEHIALDAISAILSQHYFLVTPIDYGRIYLDKLTLVFSRALIPRSAPQPERRIVFGISFVSSSSLRVVSPPLSLTPAILQVVRSTWPHGVVNEKWDNEGSYTFKLKPSTLERNSMTHIFALLRAMDAHGLRLVTSLVLGKRSRVRDFWIFSAPAPQKSTSTSSSPGVGEHLMWKSTEQGVSQPPVPISSNTLSIPQRDISPKKVQPLSRHVRSGSSPQSPPEWPGPVSHSRHVALGDDPHVLRKESPRPITPTHAEDPFVGPSAVPEKVRSREKSTPSPPVALLAKSIHTCPPSEFTYPPNSHAVRLYPADYMPGESPKLLYSTSRPQEPVYRQVPSSAFQISPARIPWDPPIFPIDVPVRPPDPGKRTSWNTHSDLPSSNHNDPSDLLLEAFRDTSIASPARTPEESFATPSELLDHFVWAEKSGQRTIHEFPIAETDNDGVARSPKRVKPDLGHPSHPGQRPGEGPLVGFASAHPGPAVENMEGRKDVAKAKEYPLQRPTTVAGAAEILAKSGYRPTVDVPMTVRASDDVSTGPWVLIHAPGASPSSKDVSVPPPGNDQPGLPLKVIPIPIPSHGDQGAYVSSTSEERELKEPKSIKVSDPSPAEIGNPDGARTALPSSGSSNSSTPYPGTQGNYETTGEDPFGHYMKGISSKFRRNGPVPVAVTERRMLID